MKVMEENDRFKEWPCIQVEGRKIRYKQLTASFRLDGTHFPPGSYLVAQAGDVYASGMLFADMEALMKNGEPVTAESKVSKS